MERLGVTPRAETVPHSRWQIGRRLGCALGIVLLLVATSARPALAEDIVAVYTAFWAGLPAAKIRLRLRDGGPGFHDEIEIETQGLPHLFTRFAQMRWPRDALPQTARPNRRAIWRSMIYASGMTAGLASSSSIAPVQRSPSAARTTRAENLRSPRHSARTR